MKTTKKAWRVNVEPLKVGPGTIEPGTRSIEGDWGGFGMAIAITLLVIAFWLSVYLSTIIR